MEIQSLCKECVKTQNHCCIMDIPFDVQAALFIMAEGDKVGITDTIIRVHPKFDDKVIICFKNTAGDITNQNCVYFRGGRCAIYNNRPDICRHYGTELIKCRSMFMDEIPFKKMDENTTRHLDNIALNQSDINKYFKRVII